MQRDQTAQSDYINPTADSEEYILDCGDTILNLVDRIWSIQDELMTHIELHGPRVVVALREEHEVRQHLKVLMDDKV